MDDFYRRLSLGKQVLNKLSDNWKNTVVRKEVETWLMVCKRLTNEHKAALYKDVRHHIAKMIWSRPYGNDPGQITKVIFFDVRPVKGLILHFIFENNYFEMNLFDCVDKFESGRVHTFSLDLCEAQVLERAKIAIKQFMKDLPLSLLCDLAPEIEYDYDDDND